MQPLSSANAGRWLPALLSERPASSGGASLPVLKSKANRRKRKAQKLIIETHECGKVNAVRRESVCRASLHPGILKAKQERETFFLSSDSISNLYSDFASSSLFSVNDEKTKAEPDEDNKKHSESRLKSLPSQTKTVIDFPFPRDFLFFACKTKRIIKNVNKAINFAHVSNKIDLLVASNSARTFGEMLPEQKAGTNDAE